MEPAVLGSRLASALVGPLVRKLFAPDAPGAGLVDKPVRLSHLVSFRGEKRTLKEKDVRRLAAELVAQAVTSPGERPFPPDEEAAVTDTLARRLLALGDLDMDDVQAVRLGSHELAQQLRRRAAPPDGLSGDACVFLDSATQWACLHILEFFTRRSSFVARTLVEHSRAQSELIARVDELITRTPRPDARDTAFERRYLPYVVDQHNHITIYGIDLRDSPDRWPLEVAYLSLEATGDEERAASGFRAESSFSVHLPAEGALLDHDCVLLRGDAGSGKTTLVQWLAVTAARNGDRVPYVLPLRTLVRAGTLPTPERFLAAVSCPLSPPAGWAERVLNARRALVLVDGLDEIPDADRHRTRAWLLGLIHAFPGNQWLLTSRPTAVRPDWLTAEGFRELLLAPMRRGEVTTFVRRWHAAAQAPEYLAPLLDALRTKRDLARLATNPLMCGLICALHRERRGFLPLSRQELYEAALSMLLARRDRERGMGAPDGVDLGQAARSELLRRIAYALILSSRTEMEQDTAEAVVERALPSIVPSGQHDAPAVFRHLLLRSGLLREPAPNIVDFVHRTFQDYLGALAAVEEGHVDVLVSRAHDPQWEDVIRMAVAHARPHERAGILRKLLSLAHTRTDLLALACLEHATSLDPQVRTEVETRAAQLIPPQTKAESRVLAEAGGPLILELLPGPDGLSTTEAAEVSRTAALVGTDGALPVLKRFRAHPELAVRAQLVAAWSQFDAEEYADEVLAHVDAADLFLTVREDAQLRALPRLGPRPRVRFNGPHDPVPLLSALDREALSHLVVYDNARLTDLTPLCSLPGLSYLHLHRCPGINDLSPLATASLSELHLCWDRRGAPMVGLDRCTQLRELGLDGELPWGVTLSDFLPIAAPLEFLFLSQGTVESRGLRDIGHWPTLRTLSLGPYPGRLWRKDWEAIAELPRLSHLFLHTSVLDWIDHAPQMPGVEVLRVTQLTGREQLDRLALCFPGLRQVALAAAPDRFLDAEWYADVFPDTEIIVEPGS
ncbi:NACHT domain-containing protein [Streptomyces sp. NPDC093568]|uniref:NACHT domain-containing protein n=1 Tax=Streptomyces sp. NPDC093568 TaxID=3366041 RepID=UPI0037F69E71